METIFNQRLRQFVNYLKINGYVSTDYEFARRLGRNRCGVSEVLSGKTKLSPTFVLSVVEKFPMINPDFLTDPECTRMLVETSDKKKLYAASDEDFEDRIDEPFQEESPESIERQRRAEEIIKQVIMKNFEDQAAQYKAQIQNLQDQVNRLMNLIEQLTLKK